MTKDWYDETARALQLAGKGTRTRKCYIRAVRMLSEFYNKHPAKITEIELQDYFLHRQNVTKWAPPTMGSPIMESGFSTRMLFVVTGQPLY